MVFLFVIARFVNLIAVGECAGLIRHDGGRSEDLRATVKGGVHGGGVNEGFKDGACGTLGDGVVELAPCVIAASDQREDVTGVRIHCNECNLWIGALLDLGFVLAFADSYALGSALGHLIIHQLDAGFDRLSGGALQIGIKRGVDPICLFIDFALRHLADDSVADEIDEVGCVIGFDIGRSQLQRSRPSFLRLLASNGTGFDHAVEDHIATLGCAFGMAIW